MPTKLTHPVLPPTHINVAGDQSLRSAVDAFAARHKISSEQAKALLRIAHCMALVVVLEDSASTGQVQNIATTIGRNLSAHMYQHGVSPAEASELASLVDAWSDNINGGSIVAWITGLVAP